MDSNTNDDRQTGRTEPKATDEPLQKTSREFTASDDDQRSDLQKCVDGWTNPETARREVLTSIGALLGGAAMASSGAAAVPGTSETSDASDDGVLGDFEDGFDGWSINGNHELFQTPAAEVPSAVTLGSSALGVAIGQAAKPRLENRDRIEAVDLKARPYLVADILPAVGDAEEVTVEVQLQAPGSGVHRSQEHTLVNALRSRV